MKTIEKTKNKLLSIIDYLEDRPTLRKIIGSILVLIIIILFGSAVGEPFVGLILLSIVLLFTAIVFFIIWCFS